MIEKKERPALARNIIALRKARNWTQQDLAEAAGYHLNLIKSIELGKSEGSSESRSAIATALNASVAQLFGEQGFLETIARLENQNFGLEVESDTSVDDVLIAAIVRALPTLDQDELRMILTRIETLPSRKSRSDSDVG